MPETTDTKNTSQLTPELLASYDRPTDLAIAPDGSQIVYVVEPLSKEADKDTEHGVSTLWIVGSMEGEPRQFTSGLWEDSNPCWSPDSKRVAFLSDRARRGKQSIYIMAADGGEGVRVFGQEGSISSLRWSPDGRYLSFVFTDPESDEEKEKKESKDDARVWDADPKWRRLWLIDLGEGAEAKAISPDARQVWSYSWSADSQKIALNHTANPRINDIFVETAVSILDVREGTAEALFNPTGSTGDMVWSRSGDQIAYLGTPGKTVNGEHLFVVDVATGAAQDMTPELTATVEGIVPFRGGEELLAQIGYGVNDAYCRMTWDGEIQPLQPHSEPWGAFASLPSPSGDGALVAGIWEDGANLPDVWVYNAAGAATRRTHINAEIEGLQLANQEVVRWESDPGVTVEAVLLTPHDYDPSKRYPLVVQIHGGPTGRWVNGWIGNWHDWGQMLAEQGFAVLYHNPRGSTGYGSDFMNALVNEVGGVEYRDLMSGVDAMIERGIADPERIGVGGWSWGGYMTAWTVTQTDRFKAAVMGAGLPNMVSDNGIGDIPSANLSYFDQSLYENPEPLWERSAIRHIRNCTTPVLILHGESDDRVNMYQSVEMYVALRELGIEHEFVTYPREPHGIRERKHQIDLMERVTRWYRDRLLG